MSGSILLTLAVAAGVTAFLLVRRRDGSGNFEVDFDEPIEPVEIDPTPDKPSPFGYKMSWLAVRSDDPARIAKLLKLEGLQSANWETGIAAAYAFQEHKVFISPPVTGWVFILCSSFPEFIDPENPDNCTPPFQDLCRSCDPVFFFSTHRVVEYHAWARLDSGQVSRAYAYLGERGETMWNHGEQTEEERNLGLNYFEDTPPEGQGDEYWDREDLKYPSEEDVMEIAGAWSLNPQSLNEADAPLGVGLLAPRPQTWQ